MQEISVLKTASLVTIPIVHHVTQVSDSLPLESASPAWPIAESAPDKHNLFALSVNSGSHSMLVVYAQTVPLAAVNVLHKDASNVHLDIHSMQLFKWELLSVCQLVNLLAKLVKLDYQLFARIVFLDILPLPLEYVHLSVNHLLMLISDYSHVETANSTFQLDLLQASNVQ